eukprot:NODE_1494_length_2458_cov_9.576577.p1 GENE.NODE_1494_length_2458_cov_9.576577~~NODE_1494_length_2458_cov_9.576577.p1  ORF type:complete len:711 (-),score=200.36 NODE_1494_length_2458_cov_9.576577:326-2179(-)
MGPSGSGKSTLLSILSGRASCGKLRGRLLVNGRVHNDQRFLHPVTGFVPQDDILHGELTVDENIRFQAALRPPLHAFGQDTSDRVRTVVEDLHLASILDHRVGTVERRGISGGQRKRVSIAMELVTQPQLLFADEPTSGLDSTTAHEVVSCLKDAAGHLGITVIAVIHQPRHETLMLFDDLVLLAPQGHLVYAGAMKHVENYFQQHLDVGEFPFEMNPADVIMDAIMPKNQSPTYFSEMWRHYASTHALEQECVVQDAVRGIRPSFFHTVVIFVDRSMLLMIRAWPVILVNQLIMLFSVGFLCYMIPFTNLDEFMMQGGFVALCTMILQGVAAQRILGPDLNMMFREGEVGLSISAYFYGKDLVALIEVTLSAFVFTAAYGSLSRTELFAQRLLAVSWAFAYTVYGLGFMFSALLSSGPALMCAVASGFCSFIVSGVYQPQLPQLAGYLWGRGWIIPALSPIRWLWAFMLTGEVSSLTDVARSPSEKALRAKGYDVSFLSECATSWRGIADGSVLTLQEAWSENRSWVCSIAHLLALGVLYRALAVACLQGIVLARTSGWLRFLGKSQAGEWRLVGWISCQFLTSLIVLFLFVEIWFFGMLRFTGHGVPGLDGGGGW